MDKIQAKLTFKGSTFTIKLVNNTQFQTGLWFSDMLEAFLNHFNQVITLVKRKRLFRDYMNDHAKCEKSKKLYI